MNDYATPPGRDPKLWQRAQRRASFKTHFATYVIINIFLWLLWFFGGGRTGSSGLPWPAWPALGWGIGLAFHYLGAYGTAYPNNVEKEYEKLMNEKENNQSSKHQL